MANKPSWVRAAEAAGLDWSTMHPVDRLAFQRADPVGRFIFEQKVTPTAYAGQGRLGTSYTFDDLYPDGFTAKDSK